MHVFSWYEFEMQNILDKTKDFLLLYLVRNVFSTNAFEWKHTV
jgi:hypothetical protein